MPSPAVRLDVLFGFGFGHFFWPENQDVLSWASTDNGELYDLFDYHSRPATASAAKDPNKMSKGRMP